MITDFSGLQPFSVTDSEVSKELFLSTVVGSYSAILERHIPHSARSGQARL
jgi:hypothetical protein